MAHSTALLDTQADVFVYIETPPVEPAARPSTDTDRLIRFLRSIHNPISAFASSTAHSTYRLNALRWETPTDWEDMQAQAQDDLSGMSAGFLQQYMLSTMLEVLRSPRGVRCSWSLYMDVLQHLEGITNLLARPEKEPPTAELSQDDIESQIAVYERQFGMTSDEFMQQVRDGDVPDTFETMAWTILLRHR